jgi:plastocyanin
VKLFLAAFLLAVLAQGQHRSTRRIRIETTSNGTTRFSPREVVAWAGDQIHWHNDTDESHDPGVLRTDGTFVS